MRKINSEMIRQINDAMEDLDINECFQVYDFIKSLKTNPRTNTEPLKGK